MDPITFTIPGIPIAQPRQRHRIAGKGKNAFVQSYTPRTLKASTSGKPSVLSYKARCRVALEEVYKGPPLVGPLRLRLTFVFQRPGRLWWKTRAMPRVLHDCKPDIDNLQKSFLDAMTGRLWKDDAQVCQIDAAKVYASSNEEPHVEVVLVQERKDSECLF